MHVLARLSYRLSGLTMEESVGYSARERAWSYATRGGNQSEDIFFTADEVAHLIDVARLYQPIAFALNFVSIFAWGILILAIYRQIDFRPAFHHTSRVLLVLLITLSLCLLFFPFFFDRFHHLLFPGGNWAFPPESLLIQVFPELFWKLEMLWIILILAGFWGLATLLGKSTH